MEQPQEQRQEQAQERTKLTRALGFRRINGVPTPPKDAGSRRRRPSRKYKKSAKRVFRKKSRSTRRR